MHSRRAVSFALLGVLGFTAVTAAQGSPPPPPSTGQATTTIALPVITITDPSGSTRSISLGALVAHAANESTPAADLGLGGPAVLGTTLPGWQIDTSGGPQSGDHDIVLATSPVSADVGIVNYDVHADATSASSSYGALTATAATSPVNVQADLGQHGVAATVTPNTSTGTLELTVTGLQISLGDLLPTDVINALPLSGLVDIVNALGLPLPAGAANLGTALANLGTDLTNAQDLAGQLATANTALAALLAALPSTALLQQQLAAAQTTLTNDLAALQAAQQQLANDTATVQQLQAQVASLTAAVDTAQQQVDTANAAVASWTAQINSLTAQINSLLGNPLNAVQIAALNAQRTATQNQLASAQAQLASAQNALAAAQAALAPVQLQLTQATADIAADQTLVTNLQQQVNADQGAVNSAQAALNAAIAAFGTQAITDAQALADQLTTSLTSALSTVSSDIAALPDLSTLRSQLLSTLTSAPLLNVGTLGATLSSAADDNSGAGTVTCTISGASVLGTSIPDGSCDDLGGHFSAITSAVAGALDQLPVTAPAAPAVGGLVSSASSMTPTASDTVTNGAASVTPLHLALPSMGLNALVDSSVATLGSVLSSTQQAFSALGLPAVTSALSGSLGTLAGTVAALPSGGGLAGLRTLGVDVTMVGLSTAAVHNRALPVVPPTPPAPPTPTPPVPPVTPPSTPGTPADPGTPATSGTGSGNNGGGIANAGAGDPPAQASPATPATPRVRTTQHDFLPFTGDNSAADLAAAFVVMLAGGHLLRLARRRSSKITS